jgi:hypothetical protein
MNKLYSVIIGVVIGCVASIGLLFIDSRNVAYSDSWWDNFLAASESADFGFRSIFNSTSRRGQDLYNLMYYKVTLEAENLALRELALSYGLTTDEAQAVLGGSLLPLFNNPRTRGLTLTQENAIKIFDAFRSEYDILSEMYDLQQEIDLIVKPSEMFANGDTSDSGFDLINDLSTIERILFLETDPVSIGGWYSEALPSPYNPLIPKTRIDDFVAPAEMVGRTSFLTFEEDEDGKTTDTSTGLVGKYQIGDEEKNIPVLDRDICDAPDDLLQALDDLDKRVADSGLPDTSGPSFPGTIPRDGESPPGTDGDDPVSTIPAENLLSAQGISSAPAGDWPMSWCLEDYVSPLQRFTGALPELQSLGGVSNSYLTGSTDPGGGAPFTLGLSLCLDVNFIKGTVSSYMPGSGCILCGLEDINFDLDKTLSHTLVPNKATGNLLESAKCKNAGGLLSMQFVTIWNPVPTPPYDETIFGKNIFEEWNRFVHNYRPVIFGKFDMSTAEHPELSSDALLASEAASISGPVNQIEMINRVVQLRRAAETEAVVAVEGMRQANEATNIHVQFEGLKTEMDEMNAFFKNFLNIYKQINDDVIPDILQKDSK